jgi:PAS domain S-box-containing protein
MINSAELWRLFGESLLNHAIVICDRQGIIKQWSAGAAELYGYAAADVIGRNFSVLHTDEGRHSGLPQTILQRATIDGRYEEDGWRQRRDGSTFWANVVVTALRDENGVVAGFGAVVRDFSRRKKALDALSLSQRIVETSIDLIFVTDRRGYFMQVSPSALTVLGYRPEEMVGRSAEQFIEPGDLEPTRSEMRQARRGGSIRNFECRYRHKDGRVITLTWTGVWSEPEQRHFFIGRDVTESRRRDHELIQVQKMEAVGQLTGGLAHDFNNLLGIIIGNLDMIKEELPADHPMQELAQAALEASLRGSQLNKSLLAFSRRQELRPECTDPASVIKSMATMLSRLIGERIELKTAVAQDVFAVRVDVSQLEAAILNLVVNARDAMPAGGRLLIEASNAVLDEAYAAENAEVTPGEYALIAISDTGSGMTGEILAKVFEPFFTTKEVGKGTGLGLSMVHGFIKQSHGHVKIYSEVERGTTVRLYLPRDRSDSEAPAVETVTVDVAPKGGETVLVVEDNEALRRTAVARIGKLGYRVVEAENAARALEILDNGLQPDVLFSDVVMPGELDGIALAHEAARRLPSLKILLTSGFTERGTGTEGQLPWPLLSKPYRNNELARALHAALAGQHT